MNCVFRTVAALKRGMCELYARHDQTMTHYELCVFRTAACIVFVTLRQRAKCVRHDTLHSLWIPDLSFRMFARVQSKSNPESRSSIEKRHV